MIRTLSKEELQRLESEGKLVKPLLSMEKNEDNNQELILKLIEALSKKRNGMKINRDSEDRMVSVEFY